MNQRLLLFDIDGTLLKTNGAGRVSTREAMLEIFGTISRLESHSFGGKTDWQTLVELLHDHGYDENTIGQHMPRYEQAMEYHLTRIINDHKAWACPGALETVQKLRGDESVLLGLVTGNVSTTAPIKLRAAGFDPDWFPVGAYGSEAMDRNRLPALAMERANQRGNGTIKPEQVIVIGDTPADIECARAVGAIAVAVRTGFSSEEALVAVRPDYLLDDLTGLDAVLSV